MYNQVMEPYICKCDMNIYICSVEYETNILSRAYKRDLWPHMSMAFTTVYRTWNCMSPTMQRTYITVQEYILMYILSLYILPKPSEALEKLYSPKLG